jgi:hypothetical protein
MENPQQGDLIEVHWLDIIEDSTADPRKAELTRRVSIGYYWEEKESCGVPVLVTTTTMEHEPSQSGYCIYPRSCVLKMSIVRKVRKKRARKLAAKPEEKQA